MIKDFQFQESLICNENYSDQFYNQDKKLGVEKYWY